MSYQNDLDQWDDSEDVAYADGEGEAMPQLYRFADGGALVPVVNQALAKQNAAKMERKMIGPQKDNQPKTGKTLVMKISNKSTRGYYAYLLAPNGYDDNLIKNVDTAFDGIGETAGGGSLKVEYFDEAVLQWLLSIRSGSTASQLSEMVVSCEGEGVSLSSFSMISERIELGQFIPDVRVHAATYSSEYAFTRSILTFSLAAKFQKVTFNSERRIKVYIPGSSTTTFSMTFTNNLDIAGNYAKDVRNR